MVKLMTGISEELEIFKGKKGERLGNDKVESASTGKECEEIFLKRNKR